MNVGSLFVRPRAGERVRRGAMCELQGVAWDAGQRHREVEVSTDGGASWQDARLDRDLGPVLVAALARGVDARRTRGRATVVGAGDERPRARRSRRRPRWNRVGLHEERSRSGSTWRST